jgi:predicted Zn-dependent protease
MMDAHRTTGNPTGRAWRGALLTLLAAMSASCLASTQQEVALGDQYAAQVAQQLPLIQDPEVARYLRVLGDSLARVSDDRELSWTFDVVDQDEVNAFAVPGGHIYVYRGLIERMNTMSELAGVVGHEIAHITQRHSMTQMRDQQRANIGMTVGCLIAPQICNNQVGSTLVNLGSNAAFSKFSRDDEAEADRFGVAYVTRAGIDPRGMTSMFGVLMAERKRNPSGVEAFFASHPVEESRIEATQAEIRKLDPALLPSLTRDTPAFRAFKTRLQALPRRAAKR